MPSSFSFLVNSQSSRSSSSSSENDSKSDQSDDDDDNDKDITYYKKRTIQNDNDMLERPSDHDDDSCSQTDDSDNDEKENDLFPSSNNPHLHILSRQFPFYDNDWHKKASLDENKFKQSINRDEASLFDFEANNTPLLDSSQRRLFSPERSRSVSIGDKNHQSRNILTTLASDFTTSAQELHSIPETDNMQTISAQSRTNIDTNQSPVYTSIIKEDKRIPISKIPIPTHSSSQSRSRSPPAKTTMTNRRIQSPSISSKIPVPVSSTSKGAFRFFTDDDRPAPSVQPPPASVSTQVSNQTTKQISPFTPITHSKPIPSFKKSTSSAGNTPSAKSRRAKLPTSDEEEDSEANDLKEAELKLKLKEQKRHGKQTGELLNKLHENYEELLEKYAQAENTIDQLRFQPKMYGDNTPPSNTSEGMVHFIQQPKVNIATLRSNGAYHTSSNTPLSSVRQVPSTTTTTSALKSTSPANSCTGESVFFDEPVQQKIIVQELTTPETIKLDLLIQTKTLSEKMKSFLTLMDANQLSLAEQQQVYESIKEDYEKLLKTLDRTKRAGDLSDIDFDGDLNDELETMKQLLKEIVKRITDNLLGKSSPSSENGRQSRLTRDGSHSSQLSVRSSLCNHDDLMEQYQKLLNAVNTENSEKRTQVKSLPSGSEKNTSHESSQSDTPDRLPPTTKSPRPYAYVSGNSDEEQQQQQSHKATPAPSVKRVESTSFSVDYIPSRSSKHHHQVNEEQTHIHGITKTTATTKKKRFPNKQEYDNLENVTKTKHTKHSNQHQAEKELSTSTHSIPTGGVRHSDCSRRTRTSDYDSGIGTNNTTKLSRDSRLNTSTMDESHYQSLEEEKRRYLDEVHSESMSSVSSSRSSGSGAASPQNHHSKYTKRFDNSSSLKQRNEHSRRKPSGHSDTYQSDIETHLTGSFDPLPQPSYQNKSHRSHHSWQPQPTISYRSRLTPTHRSLSIENIKHSSRPQTAPQISSKTVQYYRVGRKYQSGFIHRSSDHLEPMYKSSFYIDQAHTNRRSEENINQRLRQTSNNLYLDSQTGVIYRYVPNKTQPTTVNFYQPISKVKTSKDLYECDQCGSITTYHHRHHLNSNIRRVTNEIDDPGYESGNRRKNRHRRYIEHLTSSDSDSDENSTYVNMSVLNEAYERAQQAQHRSQNLSKRISRQLRLVLGTM